MCPFSRARLPVDLAHRSLRSSFLVIDHYHGGALGRGVQSSSPVGHDLRYNAETEWWTEVAGGSTARLQV